MLHELLLALQGVPGSVFLEKENGIQITKGLTFLHPAEENLCNRLCVLGSKFKEITKFINTHRLNKRGTGVISGSYARAFVYGLNEALNPYRHAILEFELEILRDPHIALTAFLKLEEFLPLFEYLLNVIHTLENRKAHNCQILDILYEYSSSGMPMIETCMQRILNCCHEVFLRQLRHWMLEGILSDPFNEFFIQEEDKEEYFKRYGVSIPEDQTFFQLKIESVPTYIPSHIAEDILFIGVSVRLFDPELHSSMIKTTKPISDFRAKEKKYAEKLIKLQESEQFSLSHFITIVDEIKNSAAEQMWKIVVDKGNLLSKLNIIKDFYLLGRGELFLAFIDQADKILKVPQTITTLRDANLAFGVAAAQISTDSEKITQQFKITLKSNYANNGEIDRNSLSKAKLEICWEVIGLEYRVLSPFHVIFTPTLIEKYNSIFRFLLGVRRVQNKLHQCWTLQMKDKSVGRESPHMQFWQLRSHMSFFIDNLQYYLQVDVLESHFSSLEQKIKTIKDYEAIKEAHEAFVNSIIAQCFLSLKPVYHYLLEILDICLGFCKLMKQAQHSPEAYDSSQLTKFRFNFQRQTTFLFRILSGVRSHQTNPHLVQLLLRIDYNKYLTLSGGHLGGPEFCDPSDV